MVDNVGDGMFTVPSETKPNVKYMIDTSLGACQCPAGKYGAFCKHQAVVWKYFTQCGPSLPPITSSDRHQMAVLAIGNAAKPVAFYVDLTSDGNNKTAQSEPAAVSVPRPVAEPLIETAQSHSLEAA